MLSDLIANYQRKLQEAEANIDLTETAFDLDPLRSPSDAVKLRHAIEMLNVTLAEHRSEMEGKP